MGGTCLCRKFTCNLRRKGQRRPAGGQAGFLSGEGQKVVTGTLATRPLGACPLLVNSRRRASWSAWNNLLRYRTPTGPIVGMRQAVAAIAVGRITLATGAPPKPAA